MKEMPRMKLRFLALLAKLPKTTVSFIMSVHPSARVEQFGSQLKDLHEIW